jgi:hypothetical protein
VEGQQVFNTEGTEEARESTEERLCAASVFLSVSLE